MTAAKVLAMAEQIVTDTIRREGSKFTIRAADKGGATKFGISAWKLGQRRGLGRWATADEVRDLEEAEAREIYRHDYIAPWVWVENLALRLVLIDWGVTSHHTNVIKELQRALTILGTYHDEIDGIAGPLTRAAVMAAPAAALYTHVCDLRELYYLNLAFREDAVQQFLKDHPDAQLANVRGWLNRCREFRWLQP